MNVIIELLLLSTAMSAPAPSPSKDAFTTDAFSADVFPKSDAFSTSDNVSTDLSG